MLRERRFGPLPKDRRARSALSPVTRNSAVTDRAVARTRSSSGCVATPWTSRVRRASRATSQTLLTAARRSSSVRRAAKYGFSRVRGGSAPTMLRPHPLGGSDEAPHPAHCAFSSTRGYPTPRRWHRRRPASTASRRDGLPPSVGSHLRYCRRNFPLKFVNRHIGERVADSSKCCVRHRPTMVVIA